MKFTFTEKRMESSDTLRAYAEKKISKLDRFFKHEGDANVTFSIERGRFLAEITIKNGSICPSDLSTPPEGSRERPG